MHSPYDRNAYPTGFQLNSGLEGVKTVCSGRATLWDVRRFGSPRQRRPSLTDPHGTPNSQTLSDDDCRQRAIRHSSTEPT